MEFKVRKGVYIKNKNNTSNMMYTILVILVFYILFATGLMKLIEQVHKKDFVNS